MSTASSPAQVALVASGSEVSLAVDAAALLDNEHGLAARVASVPWREQARARGRLDELVPGSSPAVLIEAVPRLTGGR